ncbi:MAG: translesion DNA synthesis-associated protein ImuA [Xanthomonadales bacterium]|nr:translesion DNA synthesis-associated protein ImuA [Xanthomonadales bacterium]
MTALHQPAVAGTAADPALPVRPDLWRGRRNRSGTPASATGWPALDALLPGGGWPAGAVCEVLHGHDGCGELAVLLPVLARLASPARPLVWVAPPYRPFAPALRAHGLDLAALHLVEAAPQQALWAAEQCLRAGCCGAVLLWSASADGTALRRLQLAAETGRGHAFLLRDARHAGNPSPAPLRIVVRRERGEPVLRVLKCRGLLAPPAGELALVAGDAGRAGAVRPGPASPPARQAADAAPGATGLETRRAGAASGSAGARQATLFQPATRAAPHTARPDPATVRLPAPSSGRGADPAGAGRAVPVRLAAGQPSACLAPAASGSDCPAHPAAGPACLAHPAAGSGHPLQTVLAAVAGPASGAAGTPP